MHDEFGDTLDCIDGLYELAVSSFQGLDRGKRVGSGKRGTEQTASEWRLATHVL
jgi:hypothetical protein